MGRVLFFSGAGLSADSGLGTFRGSGGLWDKYDVDKVCNIRSWLQNYDLVHEFYNKRRREYAGAEPNSMHQAIGRLQKKYGPEKVGVITQNIDDLLERGGASHVLHVHGRVGYVHCVSCGFEKKLEGDFESGPCEKCGGKIFKPSVVFFGEQAPAYAEMYRRFSLLTKKDMAVIIGTEGSVVPIAAILGDKKDGVPAKRLLCNLEPSPYINDANFDIVLYQRASSASEEIEKAAEEILS